MNTAVGARARSLIAVAMLPGALLGQERVRPVTVCEALANAKRLSTSSPVGVLGRLYCPPSFENACWLTEDHCDQPVLYAGRTWPSKIWIEFIQPETLQLKIDPAVLREKLSVIRKTTKLGMHQTMLFKSKDGVIIPNGWCNEPDEWAVVYGRISITKALQHYSGAAVAVSRSGFQVIKDEDYAEPKSNVEK